MKDTPGDAVPTISHCLTGPREAETATDVGGTKGYHHLGYHLFPWTMGSRPIGAHIDGWPTGKDLFQLSKGCLRSREGRFHRAVQEPKDSDDQ